MSISARVVIQKFSQRDPRNPKQTNILAAVQLFAESGREYGVTRYLSGYQEAGNLLQREAGVAYEQLQERSAQYERGETVDLCVTLPDEAAIVNLGFDPNIVNEQEVQKA